MRPSRSPRCQSAVWSILIPPYCAGSCARPKGQMAGEPGRPPRPLPPRRRESLLLFPLELAVDLLAVLRSGVLRRSGVVVGPRSADFVCVAVQLVDALARRPLERVRLRL